ncbi:MAG: glucose-1-phosphate adenylyltransferase [Gammaproteobacteria bacterium]|nr:glucose-1-phosphate adenylyltransferase [Gammaproteobacteria bacterium]
MQETTPQRFVSLITRETLALVLAGGRGTRLGALAGHRVKPAVPFGGKYRLIDFPLSNCINSGIRRIGVLTQYKAHSLIRHLQEGWSFLRSDFNEFVEILPAQQRTGPSWYQGTADAVYQNLEIVQTHAPRYVLVLGGDHVYKMDYGSMLAQHVESEAAITVGCVEVATDEAREFGVMTVDLDGRVLAFQEKPETPAQLPDKPGRSLISMGIYVFNTDYLSRALVDDANRPDSSHDFGKDILPRTLAAGDPLRAFRFRDLSGDVEGYWRDVGNVDAYWAANLELAQVVPPLDLYDRGWPIWTQQMQAPPAKFVFDEPGRRGMAIDSMISGGCVLAGGRVKESVLFSFVRVESGACIEESVVLPNARICSGARIRRAVVDESCVVPPGMVIGADPRADHERFEISPGGIALITPEMLGQNLSHVR